MRATIKNRRAGWVVSAWAVLGILSLAPTTLAQAPPTTTRERPVRLVLASGETIEGVLLEVGSRVYKIRVDGKVREVPEGEVREVGMLAAAGPLLSLDDVLPAPGELGWCVAYKPRAIAAEAIAHEVEKARRSKRSEDRALTNAVAPGLTAGLRARYFETRNFWSDRRLQCNTFRYRDEASAEKAYTGLRRFLSLTYRPQYKPEPERHEVFRVANVVGWIAEECTTKAAGERSGPRSNARRSAPAWRGCNAPGSRGRSRLSCPP